MLHALNAAFRVHSALSACASLALPSDVQLACDRLSEALFVVQAQTLLMYPHPREVWTLGW
jgi:hypothetical protein